MIEQASVKVTAVGDRSVVEVQGELDLSTSPSLREAISSVEAEGRPDLMVDFGGVTFVDSSGLNVLAGAVKRLGPSSVVVVGCQPNIKRLFELSGLSNVLCFYDTIESALGEPS